jgi:hypothetical protein
MPGQIGTYASIGALNQATGAVTVAASVVGSPPTWVPGLYWYNTTTPALEQWNGSAWTTTGITTSSASRYLALLTQDPVANGVVNLSDSGFVELTTSGYARQAVSFTQLTSSATYPASTSNTGAITFGPMSATMTLAVQWVALVSVVSGTTGLFLASWASVAPITVDISQSIQIGAGSLVLQTQ